MCMYLEVLAESWIDEAWGNDDGEHGSQRELSDDSIGALGKGPRAIPCLLQPLLLLRLRGAIGQETPTNYVA